MLKVREEVKLSPLWNLVGGESGRHYAGVRGHLQNPDTDFGVGVSEVTFKIRRDTSAVVDYVCDAVAALCCEQIMTRSSVN